MVQEYGGIALIAWGRLGLGGLGGIIVAMVGLVPMASGGGQFARKLRHELVGRVLLLLL